MRKDFNPWAIILAAGSGSRLAKSTMGQPKQFLLYNNKPLYEHCARVFARCAAIQGVVFVFPKEYLEAQTAYVQSLHATENLGLQWLCVSGGKHRQDSVALGLKALPTHCSHVLIHDAARPFLSATLISRLLQSLQEGHTGVIPAIAVVDTIKKVQQATVVHTPKREELMAVQTPQAFAKHVLEKAHQLALTEQWHVTDDASLLEHMGESVHVIQGEATNTKITYADDLSLLQGMKTSRPCTGFGYDVHRFAQKNQLDDPKARPVKLGGILMDGPMKVLAHSDGDVLLHALMDALLGAAAQGDIGLHFPDNDSRFDNADSAVLLHEVLRIVQEKGLQIQHVDMTIITQKPKIAPKRQAIQKNIAHLLGLPLTCINVKATTEEGLGFTGNEQGIKAQAIVTALRNS